MKCLLIGLIVLIGVAIGLILGLGLFSGYELVISMFVLFPLAVIFGTILLGKTKKEEPVDRKTKDQDRLSRWE
ncbi:MAG TPA: hypothetical protein DD618_04080 [Acholeplasmatales bacterium]|nr:hypothetical protein [Acholeplasmatales bacterium]